jgi:hypothetical protein
MDPVNQGAREFERQRCRGEGMIVGHALTGLIRGTRCRLKNRASTWRATKIFGVSGGRGGGTDGRENLP